MSQTLNPYLSFKSNAREAMEFYQSIFGGQLDVMTFGQMGGEPAEGVMHSYLGAPNGFVLMGSDTPDHMGEPSPNGSISLSGDDAALRTYWDALSDGGQVAVPLEKQPWGDEFGMVVDKYGVSWMVNISAPQA